MLNIYWSIISQCAEFLISFEGSYIIMGCLLLCTAFSIVYSIISKGL